MHPIVELKGAVIIERLSTLLARIQSLASVGASVSFKVAGTTEGFPAVLTHVGLLPSVGSFVRL